MKALYRKKPIAVWSFVLVLLMAADLKADPIPALNLTLLTQKSDQIVVGQVTSTWEIERTTADLQGRPVPAIRMGAQLRAEGTLKGEPVQSFIMFEFLVGDSAPYRGVSAKQYGMFFLRLTSQQRYVVTDPYYPFIIASSQHMVSEGSVIDRVLGEVVQVLKQSGSPAERSQAVEILKTVQLESATIALRAAASDPDISLKLQATAALLWRNDTSTLPTAISMLLSPGTNAEPALLRRLAAAVEGVKDPAAIPLLTRLMNSRDTFTRRAAASAIRHTAANSAIEPLVAALKDNDRDVRYQAVIAIRRNKRVDALRIARRSSETSLAGYWKLDEGEESGRATGREAATRERSRAVPIGRPAFQGQPRSNTHDPYAVSFDGTNDYIDAGSAATPTNAAFTACSLGQVRQSHRIPGHAQHRRHPAQRLLPGEAGHLEQVHLQHAERGRLGRRDPRTLPLAPRLPGQ